jgi:uncharacterized protein YrrD
MKRSLNELKKFSLKAKDGDKGKIKNFLFDEDTWVIRYLEVEIGSFFKEKRVLIPLHNVGTPVWDEKHFPVNLTVEEIKNSPGLEHDMPVSRQYETRLLQHYQVQPYWPEAVAGYAGRASLIGPEYPFKTPQAGEKVEETTSLRSFSEVNGYYIKATDDQFGHIEDLIIDDTNWQILFVVIDTKNLTPWSKEVLLPIELLEQISFIDKEVTINLPKEEIKNAPEYKSSDDLNPEHESAVYDFYGRKVRK